MRYLIRFGGEIATKARNTRRNFQRQLARNIRDAMAAEGIEANLDVRWSRLYLDAVDTRAADALSRVFGIQSFSPVIDHSVTTLEDVVAHGEALFRDELPGARFAVRARVKAGTGPDWPFRARDIEWALGAALLPYSAGVDLSRPDVTAHVELRDGTASFFTLVLPGPGGLPLGVQDLSVALVSGGFDSAVAAWMVMRRGVRVDYVFCNLGGDTHLQSARAVMDVLATSWSYGARPFLHVIDFTEVVEELHARVRPRFLQLVLKRQMLRVADAVAEEVGAAAIVTGDAIGQVASQTVRNLQAMSGAAERPVLRPLLGMDKNEIIARADRIGTGHLSAQVAEHCALVSKNPATAAKLTALQAEEEALDPEVILRAVAARVTVPMRPKAGPAPRPAIGSGSEVSAVPSGARVIDVRSRAAFDAWHFPGAEHAAFPQVLDRLDSFAGGPPVVAYCSFEAKSAVLAEALRRRGVEAYSFRGGTGALLAWASSEDLADPLALEAALNLG